MTIILAPGAIDDFTEINPDAKFDHLIDEYGICGDCCAKGQQGPALFKLINLAVKGGN